MDKYGYIGIETLLKFCENCKDHAVTPNDFMRMQWEKRPRAGWILMSDSDGYYYCCSQCGVELPRYSLSTPTWDNPFPQMQSIDETNYCPHCGADMRKEDTYEIN